MILFLFLEDSIGRINKQFGIALSHVCNAFLFRTCWHWRVHVLLYVLFCGDCKFQIIFTILLEWKFHAAHNFMLRQPEIQSNCLPLHFRSRQQSLIYIYQVCAYNSHLCFRIRRRVEYRFHFLDFADFPVTEIWLSLRIWAFVRDTKRTARITINDVSITDCASPVAR